MGKDSIVDELIVLDDRSTDDTARVAAHAGARVVSIDDVHAKHGWGHGKGNALWATLLVSHGDFVVWCDGDVTSFEPDWVVELLSPLLDDDSVALVKALYHRPTRYGGGGRTTELVARPLMSTYFPELTGLAQPLSGEYAGRRDVLERLVFQQGWGVEIAMLIDICRLYGAEAIAQVDLGTRDHRNRSLQSLSGAGRRGDGHDVVARRRRIAGGRGRDDAASCRRITGPAEPGVASVVARPRAAPWMSARRSRPGSCSSATASRRGTPSDAGRAAPTRRCRRPARTRPVEPRSELVPLGPFDIVVTSTLAGHGGPASCSRTMPGSVSGEPRTA